MCIVNVDHDETRGQHCASHLGHTGGRCWTRDLLSLLSDRMDLRLCCIRCGIIKHSGTRPQETQPRFRSFDQLACLDCARNQLALHCYQCMGICRNVLEW